MVYMIFPCENENFPKVKVYTDCTKSIIYRFARHFTYTVFVPVNYPSQELIILYSLRARFEPEIRV